MKWLENPRKAFGFILAVSLVHALYNSLLPLYPDEAYYWLWSRRLDLSYYDHPPMVAYLIRVFSQWGDSPFLVRLTAVFCLGVAAWYIYRLASTLFNGRVGALALVICLLLPGTNAGFTLVTPDSPLLMFWAMALFYCWRAISYERASDYLLAGLSLGGLLLSKYTAVLFLGFLLFYLALRRPSHLLKKEPWLTLLLALAIFSPVVYWNADHNWISFAFQYQHGTSSGSGIHWGRFFEFFGGLFFLFSPVFFAALLIGLSRVREYWRDDGKFYLASGALFPLCFFLYKGLFKKMELNWVAVALVPGVIFLAWFIDSQKLTKTFRAGAVLSLFLVLVMYSPGLFHLPPKANPHNRLFGYQQAAAEVRHLSHPGDNLFADHLTTASILTYYMPGHPRVSVPVPTRLSEFTYWDRDLDFRKLSGLCLASRPRKEALEKVFSKVDLVERFVAQAPGFRPREFYIYRCAGFQGAGES